MDSEMSALMEQLQKERDKMVKLNESLTGEKSAVKTENVELKQSVGTRYDFELAHILSELDETIQDPHSTSNAVFGASMIQQELPVQNVLQTGRVVTTVSVPPSGQTASYVNQRPAVSVDDNNLSILYISDTSKAEPYVRNQRSRPAQVQFQDVQGSSYGRHAQLDESSYYVPADLSSFDTDLNSSSFDRSVQSFRRRQKERANLVNHPSRSNAYEGQLSESMSTQQEQQQQLNALVQRVELLTNIVEQQETDAQQHQQYTELHERLALLSDTLMQPHTAVSSGGIEPVVNEEEPQSNGFYEQQYVDSLPSTQNLQQSAYQRSPASTKNKMNTRSVAPRTDPVSRYPRLPGYGLAYGESMDDASSSSSMPETSMDEQEEEDTEPEWLPVPSLWQRDKNTLQSKMDDHDKLSTEEVDYKHVSTNQDEHMAYSNKSNHSEELQAILWKVEQLELALKQMQESTQTTHAQDVNEEEQEEGEEEKEKRENNDNDEKTHDMTDAAMETVATADDGQDRKVTTSEDLLQLYETQSAQVDEFVKKYRPDLVIPSAAVANDDRKNEPMAGEAHAGDTTVYENDDDETDNDENTKSNTATSVPMSRFIPLDVRMLADSVQLTQDQRDARTQAQAEVWKTEQRKREALHMEVNDDKATEQRRILENTIFQLHAERNGALELMLKYKKKGKALEVKIQEMTMQTANKTLEKKLKETKMKQEETKHAQQVQVLENQVSQLKLLVQEYETATSVHWQKMQDKYACQAKQIRDVNIAFDAIQEGFEEQVSSLKTENNKLLAENDALKVQVEQCKCMLT